jgi:hypothetical protein
VIRTFKYYLLDRDKIKTITVLIFGVGLILGVIQAFSYFVYKTPFGIDFTAYYVSMANSTTLALSEIYRNSCDHKA